MDILNSTHIIMVSYESSQYIPKNSYATVVYR